MLNAGGPKHLMQKPEMQKQWHEGALAVMEQLINHFERERVNLDDVSSAVASAFFWSYLKMLSIVQSFLSRFTWWLESCPCHGHGLHWINISGVKQSIDPHDAGVRRLTRLKRYRRFSKGCKCMFQDQMPSQWLLGSMAGIWGMADSV